MYMPINSLGYSCIKKLQRDNLLHAYNEPKNIYSECISTKEKLRAYFSDLYFDLKLMFIFLTHLIHSFLFSFPDIINRGYLDFFWCVSPIYFDIYTFHCHIRIENNVPQTWSLWPYSFLCRRFITMGSGMYSANTKYI